MAYKILANAARFLRGYIWGSTIIGLFNGAVMFLGALILGVPLAATIGVVAWFTNYIPTFGAIIGGAFAVVIAFGSGGWSKALPMLVIVIIANGSLQTVVSQFALGAALKLHPLAVLFATTAGAILFGAIGGIVAAPFLKIAIDSYSTAQGDRAVRRGRAGERSGRRRAPPRPEPPAPGRLPALGRRATRRYWAGSGQTTDGSARRGGGPIGPPPLRACTPSAAQPARALLSSAGAAAVGHEVEQEADDDPAPGGPVNALRGRAPGEAEEDRRERQEDQAQQGPYEAAEGAVHVVREDPHQQQGDAREEAPHERQQATSHEQLPRSKRHVAVRVSAPPRQVKCLESPPALASCRP